MFDVFVTVLHVALFAGILAFALAVKVSKKKPKAESTCRSCPHCRNGGECRSSGKAEKETKGKSVIEASSSGIAPDSAIPGSVAVALIMGLSLSTVTADENGVMIPEYKNGNQVWTSEIEGGVISLYQTPKNPMALIQVSYFLEYTPTDENSPNMNWSGGVRYMEVYPEKGTEAALAVDPFRKEGFWWSDNLIEWRTNIPIAGPYKVKFTDQSYAQVVFPGTTLQLGTYSYLNFGREFGIFAGGCLMVAMLYVVMTKVISRSGAEAGNDGGSGMDQDEIPASAVH